jgi:hypothetical protein
MEYQTTANFWAENEHSKMPFGKDFLFYFVSQWARAERDRCKNIGRKKATQCPRCEVTICKNMG